jgi:hypothetical protein
MSVAAPLGLREGDRSRLEALTRSTSVRAGLATRARIVLLAADGLSNAEIARRTGTTRPTVLGWRNRYQSGGISALGDQPRSGRPPEHLGVQRRPLHDARLGTWRGEDLQTLCCTCVCQ